MDTLETCIVPKWFQSLMQTGYDMRQAQKRYFAMPKDSNRMKAAKAKEVQFDSMIAEAIKAGAVLPEVEQPTSQQSFFNP